MLRAGSVVLVLSLLASGCTGRQAVVGAGLGMTLVAVAELAADYNEPYEDDQLSYAAPLLIAGLITLFVGAVLDNSQTKHKPIEITRAPPTPNAEPRRAAWELTKFGQGAARRNDCDRVRILDVQVRDLDVALHASVFMRDVAIQACLALPVGSPAEPVPPPADVLAPPADPAPPASEP